MHGLVHLHELLSLVLVGRKDAVVVGHYFSYELFNIGLVPLKPLTVHLDLQYVPSAQVHHDVHGGHQVVLVLIEAVSQQNLLMWQHI